MKRSNWLVADYGIRPAGKPDECFYCNRKIATEHAEGCVVRNRTVVIKVEMEVIVEVPEDWTVGNIDFKYNESSSCSDNLLEEIVEHYCTEEGSGICACPFTSVTFLREATVEDEEKHEKYVRNCAS
jgi:hypothetical protein